MEVEVRTEKCRLCLTENIYLKNEGSNDDIQDAICSNCCSHMFDVEEICESESSDNQGNDSFSSSEQNVSPVPNEVRTWQSFTTQPKEAFNNSLPNLPLALRMQIDNKRGEVEGQVAITLNRGLHPTQKCYLVILVGIIFFLSFTGGDKHKATRSTNQRRAETIQHSSVSVCAKGIMPISRDAIWFASKSKTMVQVKVRSRYFSENVEMAAGARGVSDHHAAIGLCRFPRKDQGRWFHKTAPARGVETEKAPVGVYRSPTPHLASHLSWNGAPLKADASYDCTAARSRAIFRRQFLHERTSSIHR